MATRLSAVESRRLRDVAGSYASGVTVVTAMTGDHPVGMTIQAFHSLSLSPPLVLICAGRGSRKWASLTGASCLCVNVLSREQEPLAWRFALPRTEPFADLSWAPDPVSGAPILDGALAWLSVRITNLVDGGDHEIAVAEVVALDSRPGEPLVWFNGSMHSLVS
jgi:3-hydroxy-9,10-secoandrosta-1,3,5(10)-triene-9,17-dione monooxygenase reductase component